MVHLLHHLYGVDALLRGNIRTSSMTLWKAHGRLPIRHNWTFSLSLTVKTLSVEICQCQHFSKGCGSLWAQISDRRALPTNRCWCQNTTVIDLLRGIKISAVYYLVLSQITRVIDRHTDLLQLYCTGMHCMHRAVKITKNHELSMFGWISTNANTGCKSIIRRINLIKT